MADYRVPKRPTHQTMQGVAIPDYRIQETYQGSHARPDIPNTVFLDPNDYRHRPQFKDQILSHELQHQISYLPRQKGQMSKKSNWNSTVDESWVKNAQELTGKSSGREYYNKLQENLARPEVQEYFTKLGASPGGRIRNAKDSPLTELLADISSFETVTGKDLTQDPVLRKYLFNDDILTKLYKSTTGMSGVVIGDSDYAPYSIEAGEAWNGPQKGKLQQLKDMFIKSDVQQPGLNNVFAQYQPVGSLDKIYS